METFDVVVLGTGAAALTAAIRAAAEDASVGLFEKADTVGGTSAWSGGMVWIPMNPHMAELGISDSRKEILAYLESLSHGLIDMDLAAAMVDAGPEALSWLEENTPARFQIIKDFPDYHPERPGAKPGGGRSLECPLFPFDQLGAWQHRVTVGPQLSGNILMSETSLGRGAPQGVDPAELARRQIHDERGAGQGLVGALLKGCLDRGIEPRTGMRAVELIQRDRRVVGVRFETAAGPVEVGANRGVVIATGGFEWDRDLVRAFSRGPLVRCASVPTNTGDGLRMAMRIGAALGNMREAWWVATIDVPVGGRMAAWQVNGERTRPHTIMVNRHGKRFTNEAANYNALGAAFHVIDVSRFDYPNHPAWMIFDRHYLTRYGLAGYKGEPPTPEWIVEAPSLAALAAAIEVPPDPLAQTVARWNELCARAEDTDFGRGTSAHDRWWGDPAAGAGAMATMGPLDTPPFYAVQVYCGVLGTKGGPRTDRNGQVVDVDGRPIPGLYAAGNAMASVMGMTYGGAGGTLGPALVFGYLAGRHAARSGAAVGAASGEALGAAP
ncbi:MAG TPA: FAD-dependent oxidoreductase [Pseudonocardiaceae bacterium]|jgi:succinate dehydrogenase/fumarate reductase flavoprotein subunit